MSKESEWWTSPTESESGQLIMVTGRRDVEKFRKNPKFNIRIEISWEYQPDLNGMPDVATSTLMSEVTDALQDCFDKDPIAVMTGIYTGDGERNWIFYTLSTHIFNRKLNEALSLMPMLPLKIYAENDPDWEEYSEMKDLSEVSSSD